MQIYAEPSQNTAAIYHFAHPFLDLVKRSGPTVLIGFELRVRRHIFGPSKTCKTCLHACIVQMCVCICKRNIINMSRSKMAMTLKDEAIKRVQVTHMLKGRTMTLDLIRLLCFFCARTSKWCLAFSKGLHE